MDYQTELKTSMEAYPCLYLKEEDVLCHLFFTLGNGYKWLNGELVREGEEDSTPEEIISSSRAATRMFYQYELDYELQEGSPSETMVNYFKERLDQLDSPNYVEEERAREAQSRMDRIEFLGWDPNELELVPPLSKDSKICCIPDDIKPDWLTAAEQALNYSFSLVRTKEDKEWLRKAQKRISDQWNKLLASGKEKSKKQRTSWVTES